jgi:hypothetical protein
MMAKLSLDGYTIPERCPTNDWLLLTRPRIPDHDRRPALRLTPKLALSIQASEWHYSHPRNNRADYYTHVEVAVVKGGCPKILRRYAEFDAYTSRDILSVCGYVPVIIVNYLIDKYKDHPDRFLI